MTWTKAKVKETQKKVFVYKSHNIASSLNGVKYEDYEVWKDEEGNEYTDNELEFLHL